jgi:hypothetical protein
VTGYEPRFDHDYSYGRQGELLIGDAMTALREGQARVEVKRKRRHDDWLYVELMQDPGGAGTRWKDSGLNVTGAEWWAYVIGSSGMLLFIPTDLLRWAVSTDAGKPCAETDGDNPTEGRLFRVSWLMQAIPQWLKGGD